jgi:hypothetical protein
LAAIQNTTGINLPMEKVVSENHRRKDSQEPLLTDEHFAEAKRACVTRCANAPLEKLSGRNLRYCLWYWHEWAGPEGPQRFLKRVFESDDRTALLVLRDFLDESTRTEMPAGKVTKSWSLPVKFLAKFVSLADLEQRFRSFLQNDPPADQETLAGEFGIEIAALKEGLERWSKGDINDPAREDES